MNPTTVNPAADGRLSTFPAFFRLEGKTVVVVGNGAEAYAKTRLLLNTRANICVVANDPASALRTYAAAQGVTLIGETYAPRHLEGATLAFAATGDAESDRRIVEDARILRIPVNAVDQPDICDFYIPAIVNRAPVAVAIGTEGAGPVLAQLLRTRIDAMLSPSLGELARLASSYRSAVDRIVPRGHGRRAFWQRFFMGAPAEAVDRGDVSQARRAATGLLRRYEALPGHVWLVGAGPGAEDLLTLRAQRVLMQADAIVYDALVPQAVVDMGRRDAERLPVGKRKGCHSKSQNEINDLLVALASNGKRVARLKSGDPLIYGRAADELAALRAAEISYEIVPGITSASAAAADFELPLTVRGTASSLVFTTGHDLKGNVLPDWAGLVLSGATVAIYMGRTVAAAVAEQLIDAGLAPETAVAVVENASRPGRRLLHGKLHELPALQAHRDIDGPALIIIGKGVARANFTCSTPLAATAVAA